MLHLIPQLTEVLMTNVSKKKLKPEVRKKLYRQFATLFSNVSEDKMGILFTELFTESEQVMFIKRVGIVLMLAEDLSIYRIAKTLEVSEATVMVTKDRFQAGEYDHIVGVTKRKTFDSEKFWSVMGTILSAGLPPIVGPGRWKSVLGSK